MTAHIYCWDPILAIHPKRSDFNQRLNDARGHPGAQIKLLEFVTNLLAKHPDLTVTDDTPWATGPLTGEISGNFINIPVSWSWYDTALVAYVAETAHAHGLHCFDPQSGKFYEAAERSQ